MIHKGQNNTYKCIRCTDYKYNAPMYLWIGLVSNKELGSVCEKCAITEAFGSNYRNNKKYQQWREINGKTKKTKTYQ